MKKKIKIISLLIIILCLILAILLFFYNTKIVSNYESIESSYEYAKDYKQKDIEFFYQRIIPKVKEKIDYKTEGTIDNKPGTYKIKYIASYGNLEKEVIETVTIEKEFIDKVAPTLTLDGEEIYTVYVDDEYIDPGFKAIDDIDGDITDLVVTNSNVDTSKRGKYEIIYTTKDSSNNETSISRTVLVREKQHNADSGKIVYLTFDDGPSAYTEGLLDLLDKYDIKATFFVTCIDPNYVSMIEEEYLRGHSIAVHTYSHDYGEIYASEEAFYNDQNKMLDIIYEYTGTRPNVFRFPGGSSNSVSKSSSPGLMTRLVESSKEKGLKYFDWNVSSGDGNRANSPSFIYDYATSNLAYYDNAMLLQHDANPNSMKAMESIINWCINNGYSFNAIDDTTKEVHHGHLNN